MTFGNMKKDVQQTYKILSMGVPQSGMSAKNEGPRPMHVPEQYFRDCYGVVIFCEQSIALVVGGSFGSGVVMKKVNKGTPEEKFSAPVPLHVTGAQIGISAGVAKSYFIMFLTSEQQVEAFQHHAKVDLVTSAVGTADAENHITDGMAGRLDVQLLGGGSGTQGNGIVFANASGAMISTAIGGSFFTIDTEKMHRTYGQSLLISEVLDGKYGMNEAYADPDMKAVYSLMSYTKQGV